MIEVYNVGSPETGPIFVARMRYKSGRLSEMAFGGLTAEQAAERAGKYWPFGPGVLFFPGQACP